MTLDGYGEPQITIFEPQETEEQLKPVYRNFFDVLSPLTFGNQMKKIREIIALKTAESFGGNFRSDFVAKWADMKKREVERIFEQLAKTEDYELYQVGEIPAIRKRGEL